MNSIVQLVLFSVIPLSWWLIKVRKKEGFFHWIGLKKPVLERNKKQFYLIFLLVSVLFLATSFIVPLLVQTNDLATSQFEGKNVSTFIGILIYSFIQTGLSEEILFRGFLGKRLISKFGFTIGNLAQAILFGGLHGLLVFSSTGLVETILVMFYTGSIGFVMGWMNEKKAGGSIVPSWLLHSISNLSMALLLLFNII